MIFVKIIPPVFALLIWLLHLGLENKWRDRRTKCRSRILKIAIFLMIVSILSTILVIIKDDKSQKTLSEEIKDLKDNVRQLSSKLDPFVNVAKSNYPELNEQDALEELRSNLYHPSKKLRDFIARIFKKEGMSDSDVVKLISLTKQLIEYDGKEIFYPILLFYCDWVLSPKITESNTTYLMLSKITDVFLSDNGTKKVNIPVEVSKLLSIKKFRSQLLSLYASHNLSTILFTNIDNWKGIMGFILKEIVGKVIEFPPDVENREDYAGAVYREMKQRIASHEWFIARKLWLSNNVEGKNKGDVYWFVQTKPRVIIMGRLSMVEKEGDFTSNQ